MFLNSEYLLFSQLDKAELKELEKVAADIILYGTVPNPMPRWFFEWFEAGGFKEHDKLMIIATVLPQRLLLSVVMGLERHE